MGSSRTIKDIKLTIYKGQGIKLGKGSGVKQEFVQFVFDSEEDAKAYRKFLFDHYQDKILKEPNIHSTHFDNETEKDKLQQVHLKDHYYFRVHVTAYQIFSKHLQLEDFDSLEVYKSQLQCDASRENFSDPNMDKLTQYLTGTKKMPESFSSFEGTQEKKELVELAKKRVRAYIDQKDLQGANALLAKILDPKDATYGKLFHIPSSWFLNPSPSRGFLKAFKIMQDEIKQRIEQEKKPQQDQGQNKTSQQNSDYLFSQKPTDFGKHLRDDELNYSNNFYPAYWK